MSENLENTNIKSNSINNIHTETFNLQQIIEKYNENDYPKSLVIKNIIQHPNDIIEAELLRCLDSFGVIVKIFILPLQR